MHKFIPSWKDLRVFASGNHPVFATVPPARPMTVRDLLSHTSGLTYGFMERTNVDAAYRKLAVGDRAKPGYTLADMIDTLATLPLEFSPGTRWNYSVSTDVVGHLIEVISGQKLDAYLKRARARAARHARHRLRHRATTQVPRFAANYERQADGRLKMIDDPARSLYRAGELSLRRRRAGLDGARLLPLHRHAAQSRRARRRASARAKDRRADDDEPPARRRRPDASSPRGHVHGDAYAGVGFGLGFSVMQSPARAQVLGTPGEYAWGGAASTAFWIDPAEELIVIFMTQLMPSSSYPLRRELRVLTYAALVD